MNLMIALCNCYVPPREVRLINHALIDNMTMRIKYQILKILNEIEGHAKDARCIILELRKSNNNINI